jgi:hypothetical protein
MNFDIIDLGSHIAQGFEPVKALQETASPSPSMVEDII